MFTFKFLRAVRGVSFQSVHGAVSSARFPAFLTWRYYEMLLGLLCGCLFIVTCPYDLFSHQITIAGNSVSCHPDPFSITSLLSWGEASESAVKLGCPGGFPLWWHNLSLVLSKTNRFLCVRRVLHCMFSDLIYRPKF